MAPKAALLAVITWAAGTMGFVVQGASQSPLVPLAAHDTTVLENVEKYPEGHQGASHVFPNNKSSHMKFKRYHSINNFAALYENTHSLPSGVTALDVDKVTHPSYRTTVVIAAFGVWFLALVVFLYFFKNQIRAQESNSQRTQTPSEAAFNVINMYLGVGLWSLPYSVYVGGISAIPTLFILLVVCEISARDLIDLQNAASNSTKDLPSSTHGGRNSKAASYLALAYADFGASGRIFAGIFLCMEFIGTSVVLMLTLWDLVTRLTKESAVICAILSTAMLVPFLLHAKWTLLAYINAFALIVSIASVALAVYLIPSGGNVLSTLVHGFGEEDDRQGWHLWGIFMPTTKQYIFCVGLQMVALGSGTPAVASIYSHAREGVPLAGRSADRFKRYVLSPSFIVIGLVCLLMAIGGFLAFGSQINVLVTDNLMSDPMIGLPLALLILIATFFTTPPFIAVTSELLELLIRGEHSQAVLRSGISRKQMALGELSDSWKAILRLSVFALVVSLSVMLYSSLGLVLELTGLMCMSLTAVIFPLSMSLIRFWPDQNVAKKTLSLLLIGGTTSLISLYFVYVKTW